GLVGYWTFDGKDTNWSTNKTNDVSGQGNTGTMVSMSTTTSPVVGKIGQALRFNGGVSNANGSYIDVTNQASFNFERTNSFSSSVWIKPQTLSSTIQHIVGNLGNTSPYRGWELWIDSAGRVNLTLESTYPTDQLAVHTNSALSLNKWQNVSFTYNGTSAPSGVTIYVNGISQTLTTDQNTLSATIQNSVDFGIGQRTDNIGSNSRPFTGFIDDVRVYSRALSASEVNQLYKLGAAVSR
ncbi:MAG: LamG domain-containing protein, partial [Nanoarchaeota archaeon]